MRAFLFANVEIHDAEAYARYRDLVPDTIAKYGGRYLARGGALEVLEGALPFKRAVIVEFPSMQAARDWWNSPEYAPVKSMRHAAATSNLMIFEGLD